MATMSFEIEITRFEPELATSRTTTSDAGEAELAVRTGAGEACVILVARHDGAISLGELHVWLAAGRALLRVDEHREWYATDPAWSASAASPESEFRDSDGTSFSTPTSETVSQSQALDAMAFWLRAGEMLPDLTWT
jgi:hypothetical protein